MTAATQWELFIEKLEESLEKRYNECNDAFATPSSILLAVLNAVAEARIEAEGKL
jgi:hypothetical protein